MQTYFHGQHFEKGGIQKVSSLRRGRGILGKRVNTNRGKWGSSMCVHSRFFKKNAEILCWSFINILQFFLLIIMAVWNIKQTIIFSPSNEWCAMTFVSQHKITMWIMLKIFIYNLFWLSEYQCKDVVKLKMSNLFFWGQFRSDLLYPINVDLESNDWYWISCLLLKISDFQMNSL